MDIKKIDNVEVQRCKYFTDSYIISADYDGIPMTEEQLNKLSEDSELCQDLILKY